MSKIKLQATDGNGGTISLKGPTTTDGNAEFELTLPANDGSSGQYLKTDGSGALSWDTVTAVGGANGVDFDDNVNARFGAGNDLVLYSDGTQGIIRSPNGRGYIQSDTGISISNIGYTEKYIEATKDGNVELFFDNAKKAETVTGGFTVTGTCTATSFAGSGAALTGISSPLSFRNLLINGEMLIAQSGSQSMAHDGTTSAFAVDRWGLQMGNMDEFDGTLTQVGDDPKDGFTKCLKWTTGTAESAIANDEYVMVRQHIESQDLQHLQWGTAQAESVTLRFWVKSSITGTFGCSFYSGRASGTRVINTTYAISSANTWEQKTITIAGDTAGSVLNNDNEAGLSILFPLAAGSNYDGTNSASWADYSTANYLGGHAQDGVVTTAGATWQLTGVQLEVGSSATSFERKQYRQVLEDCRRYLWVWSGGISMHADRTTDAHNCGRVGQVFFPTTMRHAPTVSNMSMTVYTGSAQTLGTYEIDTDHIWFNHSGSFSDGRAWARINSFTANAEI